MTPTGASDSEAQTKMTSTGVSDSEAQSTAPESGNEAAGAMTRTVPPCDDCENGVPSALQETSKLKPQEQPASVRWKDRLVRTAEESSTSSLSVSTPVTLLLGTEDDPTGSIRNGTTKEPAKTSHQRQIDHRMLTQAAPQQQQYHNRQRLQHQAVVNALQVRAFHLPGNQTWWEDWRQYVANTHPVLALLGGCCTHKENLPPMGFAQRCTIFAASILCGVVVSMGALFWATRDEILQETWVRIAIIANPNASISSLEATGDREGYYLDISWSMIYLWTWMSVVHAAHDSIVWYFCCSKFFGSYLLWLALLIGGATALAGMIQTNELTDDHNKDIDIASELLVSGVIELFLCWILWFPLVATLLFSGVLGCFRVPILGGRRQELYSMIQEGGRERAERRKNKWFSERTVDALAQYDDSDI